MKEIVLRYFFEGYASAPELRADLVGTRAAEPPGVRSSAAYAVLPMAGSFTVRADHIALLVDGLRKGDLSADDLGTICFVMESSDRFLWDTDKEEGERVAEAVFWLGAPEINYPLTDSVLVKIRHYLLTGEKLLTRADVSPAAG